MTKPTRIHLVLVDGDDDAELIGPFDSRATAVEFGQQYFEDVDWKITSTAEVMTPAEAREYLERSEGGEA